MPRLQAVIVRAIRTDPVKDIMLCMKVLNPRNISANIVAQHRAPYHRLQTDIVRVIQKDPAKAIIHHLKEEFKTVIPVNIAAQHQAHYRH